MLPVLIAAILGLTLAGLQVSSAATGAGAYRQISSLAVLGQQVSGLTQALETERTAAALFIAAGQPAADLAALHRQYASTEARAARVSRLLRLGRPHAPARTRASGAAALASIDELAGLRRETAQRHASPLQVTSGYAAAIAGLFPVVDDIADRSGNPVLVSTVRALGSLSRLTDQASLQQAILGAALARGRFEPGALTALTIARAQESSDLVAFRDSATAQESWALARTLDGPQPRQARAVQQAATAAGDGALDLGPGAAAQWQAGTSYTIGWLRNAEQQLGGWVTAYARAQQRQAARSAFVTGGVTLAGLVVVLLVALLIARSVVRPLRRLEAAALDAAESRLPAEIDAVTAEGETRRALPAVPVDVSSVDEIGQVSRAIDRLREEAVRMAGEEARLRDSTSVIVAGFFRRSHYLNDRLLQLVDSMEIDEDDPERLGRLFQADSLATRMRRHSDTALVLTGHEPPRSWTEPVSLVDVLRAAASEIEQYDRVAIDVQAGVWVSENSAVDTVHLIAELLENATLCSPETTQVIVSGFLDAGGGVLIGVADAGPGLPDEHLRWLNWQLAHPAPADVQVAQQMGLFAVSHLAARHDISVVLTRAPGGGTTAEVGLPADLISQGAGPGTGAAELGPDYGRDGEPAPALTADPLSFVHRIAAAPPPGDSDSADATRDAGPEAPVTDVPVQDSPAQDAAMQDVPVQDDIVRDDIVQDVPVAVQDVPVQDVPVPGRDVPVQDEPVPEAVVPGAGPDPAWPDAARPAAAPEGSSLLPDAAVAAPPPASAGPERGEARTGGALPVAGAADSGPRPPR